LLRSECAAVAEEGGEVADVVGDDSVPAADVRRRRLADLLAE